MKAYCSGRELVVLHKILWAMFSKISVPACSRGEGLIKYLMTFLYRTSIHWEIHTRFGMPRGVKMSLPPMNRYKEFFWSNLPTDSEHDAPNLPIKHGPKIIMKNQPTLNQITLGSKDIDSNILEFK
jgi:hypothetical protein